MIWSFARRPLARQGAWRSGRRDEWDDDERLRPNGSARSARLGSAHKKRGNDGHLEDCESTSRPSQARLPAASSLHTETRARGELARTPKPAGFGDRPALRPNLRGVRSSLPRPAAVAMSVLVETTFGDITVDLDVDGSPALARNLLKLAAARMYTGSLFYNVVPGKYCQLGGERGGTCRPRRGFSPEQCPRPSGPVHSARPRRGRRGISSSASFFLTRRLPAVHRTVTCRN